MCALMLLFRSALLDKVIFRSLLLFHGPVLCTALFLLNIATSFNSTGVEGLTFLFRVPLTVRKIFATMFRSLVVVGPSCCLFMAVIVCASFFLL